MGIPLKVHWSFGLTILFVIYMIHLNGLSTAASIGFSLLVLVMFICVILHELGHCMAARRYGIDTLDIIISPIGGLARLKEIPEQPMKELVIAIAGPAVNVVIAVLVGLYLHFIIGTELIPPSDDFELLGYSVDFLKFVFFINIMLFVFNLVPAFPMDGGRVLRALLSIKFSRLTATQVAMWIARVIALGFVILAMFSNNITLGVIGAFVYIMSGKEYYHVRAISKITSKITDVYRSNFTKIQVEDTYQKVIDLYKNGIEKNFMVYDENSIIGAIPEQYIKDVIKRQDHSMNVADLMTDKVGFISPDSILRNVTQVMNRDGIAICIVQDNGEVIGVLDRNDVRLFMR